MDERSWKVVKMKQRITAGTRIIKENGNKYCINVSYHKDADTMYDLKNSLSGYVYEIHPYDDSDYFWCKIEMQNVKYIQGNDVVKRDSIFEYFDYAKTQGAKAPDEFVDFVIDIICYELSELNEDIEPNVVTASQKKMKRVIRASKVLKYKKDEDETDLIKSEDREAHLEYEWVKTDYYGDLIENSLNKMKRIGEFDMDFYDEDLSMYVITDDDAMTYVVEELKEKYNHDTLEPDARYGVDADVEIQYSYLISESGKIDPDDIDINAVWISACLYDENGNIINGWRR